MAVATCLLLLLVLVALCIGRYSISAAEVLRYLFLGIEENSMLKTVMWSVRIPRILMALLGGAGLSVSGVSLQAMFGNPLVNAHILGVSYSAGFGAALGILLFSRFAYVEILALLFGFVGMALTYFLSQKKGNTGTLMLVLSGVVVGAVFEALTSFIKYVADPGGKTSGDHLLADGKSVRVLNDRRVPGTSDGWHRHFRVLRLPRWRLNVISLSEDEAASLGINLKWTRILIILATTVIAASTVALCGVISFVGLAVPHLTRMVVGNDHKKLLPLSILTGAGYMVIIDTAARSITAAEIPLSILTALIGAPIFAMMLRRTGGAWNA